MIINFNFAQCLKNLTEKSFDIQENVFNSTFINESNQLLSDFSLKHATIGNTNNQQNSEIRTDKIQWLDEFNFPNNFYWSFIDTLKKEVNQNLFLGLKEIESHYAKYEIGDFYKKHLDTFKENNKRRLTFITYIHKEFTENDGGELVLYLPNEIKKVQPKTGSTVIFLSEEIPHEVLPTKKERQSLTGWFKIF